MANDSILTALSEPHDSKVDFLILETRFMEVGMIDFGKNENKAWILLQDMPCRV